LICSSTIIPAFHPTLMHKDSSSHANSTLGEPHTMNMWRVLRVYFPWEHIGWAGCGRHFPISSMIEAYVDIYVGTPRWLCRALVLIRDEPLYREKSAPNNQQFPGKLVERCMAYGCTNSRGSIPRRGGWTLAGRGASAKFWNVGIDIIYVHPVLACLWD